MTATRQRLKKIMAKVFDLTEAQIPDTAAFNELKGWDSLGHISLMMAVEQEFKVELTAESMQNAVTLLALEDFIQEASPNADAHP